MLTKICGITNAIDAHHAIDAGADAIGFVMGGKVLPYEIEPHAQLVREIVRTFPKNVDSFLVTHLLNADDILDLADYVKVTGIQISEPVDVVTVKQVRERTQRKIIKTVTVSGPESQAKLETYEAYADFILLDTQVGGYVGGTGVTSDWKLCCHLIQLSSKPVYLAGGLNPENVKEAILTTHPQGVDVSTGVGTYNETFLRKDRKCPQKIKEFIDVAHQTHARLQKQKVS